MGLSWATSAPNAKRTSISRGGTSEISQKRAYFFNGKYKCILAAQLGRRG